MTISKPMMEEAMARASVHKVRWLPRHGMTLGRHILVTRDSEKLIWHEVAHVYQYAEEGFFKFLIKYGWEYVVGLVMTRSHDKAYRGISYEVEARAAADMMMR